ncbi:MAG: PAS domain S-box protein [Methanomicrobiales archaeon]|nr:PAS domain S-box protein [Methanomicrobiales archaeon]
MQWLTRTRSFSFFLLLVIIGLVALIVTTITIGDLILVRTDFEEQSALLRNETEGNIITSVRIIDEGLKLFDNTLNRRMEESFVVFNAAYVESGGDPSRMDLEALKQQLGGDLELYLINESGVVEYTTYEPDLGLDFQSTIPYFYDYLMTIRESHGFYPDRVVQERATGNLRKFAYLPTLDRRYILELGLSADAFTSERSSLRYTDMIETVRERNPFIRDIRIFTTAKRLVGNKSYVPDPELDALLNEMLSTGVSREFRDPSKGITVKYLYIDLRDKDYASDMSLIVEITYDEIAIARSLRNIVAFHLLVATGGLIIGTIAAFGISRFITRPIARISEDVDAIARGDLDQRISMSAGKEFRVLEESINSMVQALKDMITRLQNSERRLSESEERYRGVVESQSEFITRFLPDGTVTFANEAYCRYFGLNCHEIIGTKFIPAVPDDEQDMVRAHFGRLSPLQPERTIEHRIILPGGDIRWQEWIDRGIFDPAGNLVEIQSVGRDITERKSIEEENRRLHADLEERVKNRTADLEAAYRELDSFSYSVSHDLRAPLRAIDGFSSIILHEYGSSLPKETSTYLEKIRENSTRMGQLIDDLLNFSRMSRQPLNRFLIDPASIAGEAFEGLRAETFNRVVHFTIREMPICSADPVLLNQVFMNLLSNALKFTRQRDVAEIETGSLEKEGKPVFYVKDNGIGFDMQYAPKIFGVFQQIHGDTSFEGTGVGLAIVERIIHRHGGRIWVESSPGTGTTFFFTLG